MLKQEQNYILLCPVSGFGLIQPDCAKMLFWSTIIYFNSTTASIHIKCGFMLHWGLHSLETHWKTCHDLPYPQTTEFNPSADMHNMSPLSPQHIRYSHHRSTSHLSGGSQHLCQWWYCYNGSSNLFETEITILKSIICCCLHVLSFHIWVLPMYYHPFQRERLKHIM